MCDIDIIGAIEDIDLFDGVPEVDFFDIDICRAPAGALQISWVR